MTDSRRYIIETLGGLGDKLSAFGRDDVSGRVIDRAVEANGWFTREDMLRAVRAVAEQMLERRKLTEWLSRYPEQAAGKDVAVIMAGNLPLVGFFDMLCVLAAGHRCHAKFSSKDSVSMEYVTEQLLAIDPSLPIYAYKGGRADAVIATGSDNTNRYFRSQFAGIPSLLRGNRASAAVLTGRETDGDLAGLADDIFSYSGLGCRNVSTLLVPHDYDIRRLIPALNAYPHVNPRYRNNFRQRSAVLRMQQAQATYGDFFILHEAPGFPASLSEITYSRYDNAREVARWLSAEEPNLQCVVAGGDDAGALFPRHAGFGRSQSPSLTDYPDGRDIMAFLAEL